MQRYFLKRIWHSLVCIIGISVIIFCISHFVGDPATLLLPPEVSKADRKSYRESLGLDDPIYTQYIRFARNVLKGDFGKSFRYEVPVFELVTQKFPATLELGIAAILFATIVGAPCGIISAMRPRSLLDRLVRGFSLLGMAAPTFWVGIMLILVFAVELRLFPLSGRGGIKSLILPAVTLGWYSTAVITRMMRSTMLEVLDSDYIRMARMKGLSQRLIILKHCLRNVASVMVTVISLQLVILLAGAVITETIFSWPGIGRLLIQAVLASDYPVIQGVTLLSSVIFVVVNLAVDILYAIIDPRIKYA
jgi:peptide/nickel transport system permease protein